MRRAQRRLCGLLAGVVILAALAAWQWHSEHADNTLLAMTPEAISRIDITWAGRPTQHFVKRGNHWYRGPAPSSSTDGQHADTLAALVATPVLQWRDVADVDLSRIGLTKPSVIVQLDGHTLAYGTLAAFGPQRFVRVGDRIAVVAAAYSPRPAAPASPSSSQKS